MGLVQARRHAGGERPGALQHPHALLAVQQDGRDAAFGRAVRHGGAEGLGLGQVGHLAVGAAAGQVDARDAARPGRRAGCHRALVLRQRAFHGGPGVAAVGRQRQALQRLVVARAAAQAADFAQQRRQRQFAQQAAVQLRFVQRGRDAGADVAFAGPQQAGAAAGRIAPQRQRLGVDLLARERPAVGAAQRDHVDPLRQQRPPGGQRRQAQHVAARRRVAAAVVRQGVPEVVGAVVGEAGEAADQRVLEGGAAGQAAVGQQAQARRHAVGGGRHLARGEGGRADDGGRCSAAQQGASGQGGGRAGRVHRGAV